MIHISKSQMDQVQYLIDQSLQGNHVLFDHDSLKRVLRTDSLRPMSEKEAFAVEHHIERMIGQPSLEHKRAYLETLDSRTYAWVVRAYFNIIENNLYENQEVRH